VVEQGVLGSFAAEYTLRLKEIFTLLKPYSLPSIALALLLALACLLVSCGVNPGSPDLDREIARFEWKVDAGAQLAVTQPVFDVDVLLAFIERVRDVRIPVIAGVWPLASYRNAEFMNNEVPGVTVPQHVLDRMRGADTKDKARAEGVAIARESLEALLPHVQGVQISAPFGRVATALEVAEVIPSEKRQPTKENAS